MVPRRVPAVYNGGGPAGVPGQSTRLGLCVLLHSGTDLSLRWWKECGAGEECAHASCTRCSECAPGGAAACLSVHNAMPGPEVSSGAARLLQGSCIPRPLLSLSRQHLQPFAWGCFARRLPHVPARWQPLRLLVRTRLAMSCADMLTPGAVTAGGGKTRAADCFCRATTYPVLGANGEVARCKECPVGALCGDGSCALATRNQSCPDTGQRIVGEWVRNADFTFSVKSCPGK